MRTFAQYVIASLAVIGILAAMSIVGAIEGGF
jgi:hypothetical protein